MKYPVLAPHVYNQRNGESEKAEIMFERFVGGNFSYDDISNHPDYLAYASAEFLRDFLPKIIEEMLARKDLDNYLVYPVLMNINLDAYRDMTAKDRVRALISLADKELSEKVCELLEVLMEDPPIPRDEIYRLQKFWRKKIEGLQ